MSILDKEQLIGKFQSKQARVAVIGPGYVGLPLAVVFAEAGFADVGAECDDRGSVRG